MIDYSLWKLRPFGYHLTNILLHILNAILLYIFVYLLIKDDLLALFAAAFFASHPINTSAVNHISFREELLVVLFFLSAFILFIRHKSYQGLKRKGSYLCSCLLFLLAAFSKEMAITFPLMIILYDFYFELDSNIKKIFFQLKSRYLGFIISAIFYLVIYFGVFSPGIKFDSVYTADKIYTHLIAMINIFARYITELFFPFTISILPANYTPPILIYKTIVSLCVLLLALIMIFKVYRYSRLISFCICWFFVTMLPVSGIIPLTHMFAFRYVYLAGIGFCLVLADICRRLIISTSFKKVAPNLGKIIVISIIGFYIAIVVPQNMFWRNTFTFNKNQIMYYPRMPNAYEALGQYYMQQGRYSEAIANLRVYLQYKPDDAVRVMAYNDLGLCYLRLGMYDKAIDELNKALRLRPDFPVIYYNLGTVYLERRQFSKAIEYFTKAVEFDHEYADAYNNLGVAYSNSGQNDEARKFFRKALEFDSTRALAARNLEILENLLSDNRKKD
jgi:lipoprotein NlpI